MRILGCFAGTDYSANGDITVQDESSQLVAPALDIQGNEDVLGVCAAPGGKTTRITPYLKKGHITTLNLYDHELALVMGNTKHLHVADKTSTQRMDATAVHEHFTPGSFDEILVGTLCLGIDLIRHKPDVRYSRENQDLSVLQEIQLQILDNVHQALRKGGMVTYNTYTIFSEENFQTTHKFLETYPNFEQVKLSHAQEDIVRDGCITITSERYQTDGFFIGQVKRIL